LLGANGLDLRFYNSIATSTGNEAYNNIFSWSTSAGNSPIVIDAGSACLNDYNLSFGNGAALPGGTHNVTTTPVFNGPLLSALDLTLQSGSPARGAAGPLTLANGNGMGSIVLMVDNADPFWPGDVITVGAATATVVTVDSATQMHITPGSNWDDNDPVTWRGQTDIGAYPYKAGGYTLTGTWVRSANNVVCTPNDATLVRQMVVYVDGIPRTPILSSPFTDTGALASGTVTAVRLYKLYASADLWFDATEVVGIAGGTKPGILGIRLQ